MNLRQTRWIEYMKDCDLEICYHPRKIYVVANTLSRKFTGLVAHLMGRKRSVLEQVAELNADRGQETSCEQFERAVIIDITNSKATVTDPFLLSLIDKCKCREHLEFQLQMMVSYAFKIRFVYQITKD